MIAEDVLSALGAFLLCFAIWFGGGNGEVASAVAIAAFLVAAVVTRRPGSVRRIAALLATRIARRRRSQLRAVPRL